MRFLFGPGRMALPPPLTHRRSGKLHTYDDARGLGTAALRRAKVVLLAMALVASILFVAIASWPLKILVVLAFVRGVFASDLVALRNATPPVDRRSPSTTSD